MAFQIKDFASIVAGEINHAKGTTDKITDFIPGSVARTIMEAPAQELEELYLQMFIGLKEAIPVATFLSFGFGKLPASYAQGYANVSSSPAPTNPIDIPLGTVFTSADGRTYTSTQDTTWLAGAGSIRVPITSSVLGTAGNIAAGLITSCALFPSPFTVGNSALVNGRDAESDAEQEARFADYVASLSRGTVTACLYAVRQSEILDTDGNVLEYVTRTGIDEQPGIVTIYAYSSQGIPSTNLITLAQTTIDGTRDDQIGVITPGYRAAGVRVTVEAMSERAVPLSIQVGMQSGFTLDATTRQALTDAFSTTITAVLSGSTLYIGALNDALLDVTGIETVVPSTNQNITCGVYETLIPGTLTITSL